LMGMKAAQALKIIPMIEGALEWLVLK